MKVLISAYACEPDRGSEPGVGWNWVKIISRQNETWIITRRNNRQNIELELARNPMPNAHFEYIDLPKWMSFFKKGQRGVRTYYYLWQFAALKKARQLNDIHQFDVGHHVTFVNNWIWTFFALTGIPFVWGPIGSNYRAPAFLHMSFKRHSIDTVRFLFQFVARLLDPLFWLSAIKAGQVLIINRQSLSLPPLSWLVRKRVLIEPAIGVEGDLAPAAFVGRRGVIFCFVGRFIPVKCPHLAVDAFAEASKTNKDIRLVMLGEGPMEPELKSAVMRDNISGQVKFVSWLPRKQTITLMNEADVLLFPSVEGAGMVVLEALALGKPVVCLDFGGPGEFVDETCGIRVEVEEYRSMVNKIAFALTKLAADTSLRRKLGEGAKLRSKSFHWQNKEKIINNLYKSIAGKSAQRRLRDNSAISDD